MLVLVAVSAAIPEVAVKNSAMKGLTMPAMGLGTGAYSFDVPDPTGAECWGADANPKCTPLVTDAIGKWLKQGGKRLDCANSYINQKVVGEAWKKAGVKREDVWFMTKVGPSLALGYDDITKQFEQALVDLQVDYVEGLLIHWPFQNPSQGNVTVNGTVSSDPACLMDKPSFNGTKCRLDSWRALVDIFATGKAKSIGVSNYYEADLQEIVDAGMPLPSLNQLPFHLYRSSSQVAVKKFMEDKGIVYQSYSPFGVPDWWHPPASVGPTPLMNPVVLKIAAARKITPAQVVIQWQWSMQISSNPRTYKVDHMKENLAAWDVAQITADDVKELMGQHQVMCTEDPDYYDCAPAKRQILPKSEL